MLNFLIFLFKDFKNILLFIFFLDKTWLWTVQHYGNMIVPNSSWYSRLLSRLPTIPNLSRESLSSFYSHFRTASVFWAVLTSPVFGFRCGSLNQNLSKRTSLSKSSHHANRWVPKWVECLEQLDNGINNWVNLNIGRLGRAKLLAHDQN